MLDLSVKISQQTGFSCIFPFSGSDPNLHVKTSVVDSYLKTRALDTSAAKSEELDFWKQLCLILN